MRTIALLLALANPPPAPAAGPLEAKVAEEFKGWAIVGKAVGDLNGDSLPDAAVTLRRGDDHAMLAVLLGTPAGGFRVHTRAPGAVCVNCGALVYGDLVGAPAINAKGILLLTYEGGGTSLEWTAVLKWRHDRKTDRFLLIGETREYRNTKEGGTSDEDINYLTHKMLRDGGAERCRVKPWTTDLRRFDWEKEGLADREVEGSCK
jgi:hypothetical protein